MRNWPSPHAASIWTSKEFEGGQLETIGVVWSIPSSRRELKWKPLHNFNDGLDSTIDWYVNNRAWWEPLLERIDRH